jgi:hypothetical protein
LRVQLERIEDKVNDTLLLLVVVGAGVSVSLAFWLSGGKTLTSAFPVTLLILTVVLSFIGALRALNLVRVRSNYLLGLSGERFVAEELSKLVLGGCHVFHDFPGGSGWNIDHILVAESGVFAIETKTRRKGKTNWGKRDYIVEFDGKELHYPHTTDSYGLEQAKANAQSLSRLLSQATGQKIWVEPILVLPGWMVNRRAEGEVKVINPKEIARLVLTDHKVLSDSSIKQICSYLDQKCRDVEF